MISSFKKIAVLVSLVIVNCGLSSVTFAGDPACGNAGHGWLPWPWAVYKGQRFTQKNHCGATRTMVGTKNHPYWRDYSYTPKANTVCKNTFFIQTLHYPNGHSSTRPNWGTSLGTSWTPSRSSRCVGTSFTQRSNCNATRVVTGTKPVGAYKPAAHTQACGTEFMQRSVCGGERMAMGTAPSNDWYPAVTSICKGQSFTQKRSCGGPRRAIGTKVTNDWSPAITSVCAGETFTQTRSCGGQRSVVGTKTTNDWSPSVNTVCKGVSFTQTRSCGSPRAAVGTKTGGTCGANPDDLDGDGIINENDAYPLQHNTECSD